MLVQISNTLSGVDGQALQRGESPLILRDVLVESLLASYPGEEGLLGAEKMRRWNLASRIQASVEAIDLSAENIVLLKTLVGKGYGPVVVGPVWAILDPSGNARTEE